MPLEDRVPVGAAIDTIISGLEKAIGGLTALRRHLEGESGPHAINFDAKDPRNKYEVGGLEKLTPRGVEICYRLFDRGLSRYAVARAMGISFGAATHRFATWQKSGGSNRMRQSID